MNKYISVKKAAEITGVSQEAIYQAVRRHGVALGSFVNGRWRISPIGLARWRAGLPIAERPASPELVELLRKSADALESGEEPAFRASLARIFAELCCAVRAQKLMEGATDGRA